MDNRRRQSIGNPWTVFSNRSWRSVGWVRGVVIPVVTVLVALVIRSMVLGPVLGDKGRLITFFLAIVISVGCGGFLPGVLATILSAIAGTYFFVEPVGSFAIESLSGIILVGYFVATGLVVSVMGEMLLQSREREILRNEELSAEREKLRVSLASIGDAVVSVNAERCVTFMNPAAEALTGWNGSEVEGVKIDQLLKVIDQLTRLPQPSSVDRVFETRRTSSSTGHPVLVYRDGSEHPIDETASPIHDAQGNVTGVMLVFRDVTEKKNTELSLRASEERLRLATSAADIGIWDYDPTSRIVACDDRARRHFGVPDGVELHYDDLLGRLHPDDRSEADYAVRAAVAQKGMELDVEVRTSRPDAAERWIEVRGKGIASDASELVRFIGTVQDITTRKQAEETLRESDRLKNEFLATLAHELRNPLAPILSGLHILKLAETEEQRAKARAMMERQVAHMVHLVNDLLDISRITRGKIHLRKRHVQLKEVLEHAIEASHPLLESGKHELVVDIPNETLPVLAESTRLVQIFSNLLNNSAKYTPEHGHISLSARRIGDHVEVKIRDDGVGIKKEMLPRVFEMFAQSDRILSRSQGGLGIGLTLVHSLVKQHGGTVEAESDGPGKGSTFTVSLPLESSAQPIADSSGSSDDDSTVISNSASHKLKILVVDDNVDAAESLALILRLQGNETRTVHNGDEALREATSFQPDLVFLDIGLPGIDGHEVARRLRARPEGKHPVLIALTGWGSDQDRRLSKDAGFDHHLIKPVEGETLEQVIGAFQARHATPGV